MKEKLKQCLKKMPGLKRVFDKQIALEAEIDTLQQELRSMASQMLTYRLAESKRQNQPLHAVFVCHRPALWESLRSVYEAMDADPRFRVSLVAIPNKKQLPDLGLNHQVYESEGAEEFFREYNALQGYDYNTGAWLDLKALAPDYLFFQTPYNICRPPQYHSREVAKYAKVCYVSYFGILHTGPVYAECNPLDFLGDLSYFFTQNPQDQAYITQRLLEAKAYHCQAVQTGFPRYDTIAQHKDTPCEIWNRPDSFKILWTPRWTTNEGNCHFFDYKDLLVDFCQANKDIELVFRPHPQAFTEWNATGELPEAQAKVYQARYVGNLHLDFGATYLPTIYTSHCLITDRSSLILDYFCTGNPIIYCTSHGVSDDMFPEYMECMYCADNWEAVVEILEKLKQGVDPLKEKRQALIARHFLPGQQTAGQQITECLANP